MERMEEIEQNSETDQAFEVERRKNGSSQIEIKMKCLKVHKEHKWLGKKLNSTSKLYDSSIS